MEVLKKKKGNILSKNVSQKRKVMHKEKNQCFKIPISRNWKIGENSKGNEGK